MFLLYVFLLSSLATVESRAEHRRPDDPANPVSHSRRPEEVRPKFPYEFELAPHEVPVPHNRSVGKAGGQCYRYAATSVVEYLLTQSRCLTGKTGGPGDISELYYSTGFSKMAFDRWEDVLLKGPHSVKKFGYVRFADLPKEEMVPTLTDDKIKELEREGKIRRDFPAFSSQTLFSRKMDSWADIFDVPSGVTDTEVDAMKAALIAKQGPILLTFRNDAFHGVMVRGWNDKGFLTQDSVYDERKPDGRPRFNVLPFDEVKAKAIHGESYFLDEMPVDCPLSKSRDRRFLSYLHRRELDRP